MDGLATILGLAAILAVCILGGVVCAQVPSEGRAKGAAENLGLHDVRVTHRGVAWGALSGCKEDDITKFTVVGTDAGGRQRTIQVCAPIIGGYTVRN